MKLVFDDFDYYDHVDRFMVGGVCFREAKWLFWANGMTFGSTVFFQTLDPYPSALLIAHELVHVEQFCADGKVKFLFKYFKEYLANRIFAKMTHRDAYLHISYEVQARMAAQVWYDRAHR